MSMGASSGVNEKSAGETARRSSGSRFKPAGRQLRLRLDVGSLLALRAGGDFEADALVFRQGFEAGRVDRREVREQIVAAIIRLDEAKTLGIVKPFYSASRHVFSLLKVILSKTSSRPQVFAMAGSTKLNHYKQNFKKVLHD
jgi:hypothetical protein